MKTITLKCGAMINDAHRRMHDWDNEQEKLALISKGKEKIIDMLCDSIKRKKLLMATFNVIPKRQSNMVLMEGEIKIEVSDEQYQQFITEPNPKLKKINGKYVWA